MVSAGFTAAELGKKLAIMRKITPIRFVVEGVLIESPCSAFLVSHYYA